MDPRKGAELRQSGQSMTREDMLSRMVVQRQIQDAAVGFAAQADPSVSPAIAVAAIGLALEQAGNNDAVAQPLMALLAQYQAMATQMQQPQGTPQEVAPPDQGIT
jgi:hypothetical protein